MNVNIEFKNLPPDETLRKLIEQSTRKLRKKLAQLAGDAKFLRVLVEENPARKLYRVSITLELPKKTLASQEERHDLNETVRDAFIEIDRQIETYKATLRGEHEWKRRARREELRKNK
ncbi:MAG TPA: HPF/RaiA family ribosome-associated protein [Candidatus Binatia bacterium]|nr:HPF/RaiA family ribosome-associated protein [Candidatus Binatia bacterium]